MLGKGGDEGHPCRDLGGGGGGPGPALDHRSTWSVQVDEEGGQSSMEELALPRSSFFESQANGNALAPRQILFTPDRSSHGSVAMLNFQFLFLYSYFV